MIWYLLVCVLLALLFGGAYYAYRVAFFSPKEGRDKIPSISGPKYEVYGSEIARIFHQLQDHSYEYVSTRSRDGLLLSGRYYHVQDGAPLAICFHGYRSSCFTDFSGGSELCFKMGHNVLLVDQRAHGKSQGKTITFGIKERQDLLCWIDYALYRFGRDTQLLLYGVSMGGATVLMASELDLPQNVKAIIADCPYSSPLDIILHVGKRYPIPRWLMKPFVILGAWVYGGFDIRETDAQQAVRHSKTPILIIHGEADGFVPCEMSDLVSANPHMITRVTFPNADHGLSYVSDLKRYHETVISFLKKHLS